MAVRRFELRGRPWGFLISGLVARVIVTEVMPGMVERLCKSSCVAREWMRCSMIDSVVTGLSTCFLWKIGEFNCFNDLSVSCVHRWVSIYSS